MCTIILGSSHNHFYVDGDCCIFESSPTASDREEPGAQWELESGVALESMP